MPSQLLLSQDAHVSIIWQVVNCCSNARGVLAKVSGFGPKPFVRLDPQTRKLLAVIRTLSWFAVTIDGWDGLRQMASENQSDGISPDFVTFFYIPPQC